MYVKLIVAVVLVLALGLAGNGWWGNRGGGEAYADAKNITLVPQTLGSSGMLKSWHNNLRGSITEVGALYAAGSFGPAPIMLDFRRGDPRAHNGIGCFLTQGETLVSEHLNKFRTASGLVVFDLGVTRSGDELQMTAATACTPKECRGQRLPFAETLGQQWSLKNLLSMPYAHGVVPVAVILKQKIGPEGQSATIGDLRAELERAMPLIDFTPAQRLAASQAD
ncbi:MAG: hypothetical protein ACRES9_05515 [Gammaproteobacteria bacterium]